MSLEDLSNYWNLIFVAPLGFLLHKFVNHSNRITTLETTQKFYVEKVEKICKSNEDLQNEVHEMIGRLNEHLSGRKSVS